MRRNVTSGVPWAQIFSFINRSYSHSAVRTPLHHNKSNFDNSLILLLKGNKKPWKAEVQAAECIWDTRQSHAQLPSFWSLQSHKYKNWSRFGFLNFVPAFCCFPPAETLRFDLFLSVKCWSYEASESLCITGSLLSIARHWHSVTVITNFPSRCHFTVTQTVFTLSPYRPERWFYSTNASSALIFIQWKNKSKPAISKTLAKRALRIKSITTFGHYQLEVLLHKATAANECRQIAFEPKAKPKSFSCHDIHTQTPGRNWYVCVWVSCKGGLRRGACLMLERTLSCLTLWQLQGERWLD